MIHLVTITPDNWRFDLRVHEEQKAYVADATTMMARAYAYRHHRSHAYVVYNDDTPVGMAMYNDSDDLKAYNFSQLFIDHKHQRKGYGKQAAKLLLDEMKSDGKYNKVVLCYVNGDIAAKKLYERMGFQSTGEGDGDEVEMEMVLD